MRKSYTLLVFIFVLHFLNAQQFSDKEYDLVQNALDKAKVEQKKVFVNYYSTSCEYSNEMKKQMKDDTLKSLFETDYVVVDIEVPEELTAEYVNCNNLVKSFGEEKCNPRKFPFWYILDENGDLMETSFKNSSHNKTGYPSTKKDVFEFVDVIRNTSKLTEDELSVIVASFHENNKKIVDLQ